MKTGNVATKNYLEELGRANNAFLQQTSGNIPGAGNGIAQNAALQMGREFLAYQAKATELLSSAQLEIARSGDQLSILGEQNGLLESQNTTLKDEKLQLVNKISTMETTHITALSGLQTELATAKSDAEAEKTKATSLEDQLNTAKADLEALKTKQTELEEEINRLKEAANKKGAENLGLDAAKGKSSEKGESEATTEKLTAEQLEEKKGSKEPEENVTVHLVLNGVRSGSKQMTITEFREEYARQRDSAEYTGGRHSRDFRTWRELNGAAIENYVFRNN